MWSPDGRELIYDVIAGRSEIVTVSTTPSFSFGNPSIFSRGPMSFSGPGSMRPADVAPDGRVLGRIPGKPGSSDNSTIHVVLNWFEELKQLVPVN
jgi:hypothetical protein